MESTTGIYRIFFEGTSHVYVGSSINISERIRKHKRMLCNNRHVNPFLQNVFNKHEKYALFEIMEICAENELLGREQHWYSFYAGAPDITLLNLCSPDRNWISDEARKRMSDAHKGKRASEETRKELSRAFKGRVFSDEHKEKISKAKKGKGNAMYGKHLSEEHRQKISEALKGKVRSEEHCRRISEAKKGRPNGMLGKHLSEEHRRRISRANKGKPSGMLGKHHSEETKRKMSKPHRASRASV